MNPHDERQTKMQIDRQKEKQTKKNNENKYK